MRTQFALNTIHRYINFLISRLMGRAVKIMFTNIFLNTLQILMSVSLQVPVLSCVQILKETIPVPVPTVIFRVNLT